MGFFQKTPEPLPIEPNVSYWGVQIIRKPKPSRESIIKTVAKQTFIPATLPTSKDGIVATMDYDGQGYGSYNGLNVGNGVPMDLFNWYASQGFIGYQACMIMAQNWLIGAACEIPVLDALRKGHEVTRTGGEGIDPDYMAKLKAFNKTINLKERLINYGKYHAVFGYRIAIFKVESDDPDYYANPFNIDGVTKDSYKGIAFPDPYYVSPQLSGNFDPADVNFMQPEYWMIGGKKYHHSHCIIWRYCDIPDLLKPVYLYGGISLVQLIYEAVYSAASSAQEVNRLLMTKRLLVRKGDVASALLDQSAFEEKMEFFRETRDNYGENIIDTTEDLQQLETTLTDVTNVISQKFELVSAVARIPVNKLMQTPLQGFAASGEAEEAIYNGRLGTDQELGFTPLLERHYQIAQRSLGLEAFDIEIAWPPIDTITELEQAQINQAKASTDQAHIMNGTLSGEDARGRIVGDKASGYHGIDIKPPVMKFEDDEE